MRNVFCRALLAQSARHDFVFLTGDLGYGALEPLRVAMGHRFVNAGLAEQNMVSVAAGLANEGLRPWAYSIAPFVYARPYEQIRNDVCLHNLPVVLVGNGGGYGYGVMGATHHALEDYGALTCLPNLRAYVPAFDADVADLVQLLFETGNPAYLRLGVGEEPRDVTPPAFSPWRKLCDGPAGVIVAVGPIAGGIWGAIRELPERRRAALWVLGELPPPPIPAELFDDVARCEHAIVVEEHVAHGGAGEMLARLFLLAGRTPKRFSHRCALGYPSGRYGSQHFHRRECELDVASVLELLAMASTVGTAANV